MTDFFSNLFIGLVIAASSSYITVRLSIHRFFQEKWWEQKRSAYSGILEALHHLKNYAAAHYEHETDSEHLTEEKRQELNADWKKYSRELDKSVDLASFYLSSKAALILDDYYKAKRNAVNHHDIYSWVEGDFEAVSQCLKEIKSEALRDLSIKK